MNLIPSSDTVIGLGGVSWGIAEDGHKYGEVRGDCEGIKYVCDWVNDDQPYTIKMKNGELVSVPYALELNDTPLHIVHIHGSSELYRRARDQFEVLYREGKTNGRIMATAVHPYITGVPHRIKYFDRLFNYISRFEGVLYMRGADIHDWYKRRT